MLLLQKHDRVGSDYFKSEALKATLPIIATGWRWVKKAEYSKMIHELISAGH